MHPRLLNHRILSLILMLHRRGKRVDNTNYEEREEREGVSVDQWTYSCKPNQNLLFWSPNYTTKSTGQFLLWNTSLLNQREFSRVGIGRVQGSVFIITRKQPGNPENFDRDAKDKNERHEFFPSSLFYSSFLHYKSRLRSIKVLSCLLSIFSIFAFPDN